MRLGMGVDHREQLLRDVAGEAGVLPQHPVAHHDIGRVAQPFVVGKHEAVGQPAPVTGQHSIEILRELGRSEVEIKALIDAKIVNPGVGPHAPAEAPEHV